MSFSTKNPDADRRIWLKIANRVGAEAFMDAVWQKRSEIGNDRTCLRDYDAFQALLNGTFQGLSPEVFTLRQFRFSQKAKLGKPTSR